jgi:hypothetical protein
MQLLTELGKIGGIAGIALGVLFLIFRDTIQSEIAKHLTAGESYKLLRLVVILSFLTGVVGICTYLAPHTFPRPQLPIIPGDTAWIFAGYFNPDADTWTNERYIEHAGPPCDGRWIGDTVRTYGKERRLVIVGYKVTGLERKMETPVAGYNEDTDITGVVLPVGTELRVRDVSSGRFPDRDAACWLRIAYP